MYGRGQESLRNFFWIKKIPYPEIQEYFLSSGFCFVFSSLDLKVAQVVAYIATLLQTDLFVV